MRIIAFLTKLIAMTSFWFFVAGVFFTLWYQMGLYGFYMAQYHTQTHTERWAEIMKDRAREGMIQTLKFLAFWAIFALAGPALIIFAKLDRQKSLQLARN